MLRPAFLRLLLLVPWLVAGSAWAAPMRVTAWDLTPASRSPAGLAAPLTDERLKEIAASLRGSGMDVILLSGLPNRSTAERLTQLLQPSDYRLIQSSSFAVSQNGEPAQLALISKEPAFVSQSVDWERAGLRQFAGGFVFAGFRYGKQPICLYAVRLDSATPGASPPSGELTSARSTDLCASYLLRHMNWVEQRLTNQAVGFFIASQTDSAPLRSTDAGLGQFLEKRGCKPLVWKTEFENRLASRGQTVPFSGFPEDVLGRNLGLIGLPAPGERLWTRRSPVTYELAVGLPQPPEAPAGWWNRSGLGRLVSRPWTLSPLPLLGLILLILLVAFCGYSWWRRRDDNPPDQRITVGAQSGLLVFEQGAPKPLPPARTDGWTGADAEVSLWQGRALKAEQQAEVAKAIVRQGLIAQLAEWMKQKLVVGLLAQRRALLDSSQNGSKHLAELEGRLGKIQAQFQQRLSVQEERILALEREVAEKERIIQEYMRQRAG